MKVENTERQRAVIFSQNVTGTLSDTNGGEKVSDIGSIFRMLQQILPKTLFFNQN
jgi:hypothetical protein